MAEASHCIDEGQFSVVFSAVSQLVLMPEKNCVLCTPFHNMTGVCAATAGSSHSKLGSRATIICSQGCNGEETERRRCGMEVAEMTTYQH